jgi:hypothetical protein
MCDKLRPVIALLEIHNQCLLVFGGIPLIYNKIIFLIKSLLKILNPPYVFGERGGHFLLHFQILEETLHYTEMISNFVHG